MSGSTYNPLAAGVHEVRHFWGWFLFLGIALTILGIICIAFDVAATFATVWVFGWLLLISGVVQFIHSLRTRTWSGFLLYLLGALLRGFTGFLLIRYPLMAAATLTILLASFFIVGGLFRAIGCAKAKFPRWGWGLFSGVVSTVLGILLLVQMPVSAIWFVGFAIGVDLIIDGVAMVSFATAIHHLPGRTAFHPA